MAPSLASAPELQKKTLSAKVLSTNCFAKFKTGKEKENFTKKDLRKLNLICSGFTPVEQNVFQKTLEKGFKIGQAVNFVRDLTNGPPNLITVDYVADQAKEIATKDIKEIVLTGVNIGDYGKGEFGNKKHEHTFLDLVKALDEVEGIERLRISSIVQNFSAS